MEQQNEQADADWRAADVENRRAVLADAPVPGRRVWVQAPAGGGKTTFLLSIAKAHPDKAFLLVTFSRALKEEVQAKAREAKMRNLRARTVDSLCWEAAGGNECTGLTDYNVIEAFFPNLRGRPWMKKGGRNIGSVCESALRCTGKVTFCAYHRQAGMDYVMDGLLGKGSVAVHSHAGNRRALYDAGKPLLPEGSRVDCILCDEVQDLDDQAMRLLERCPQQIVYVGDPNQKIYGFGDAFKCKCQFEASPAKPPYFPEDATVRLYRTFRLNRETVAFLRKTFPFVPMVAADGAPSVPDAVLPVPALPPLSYPGLCHLFRSNLDLCRAVERLPENVRVVGGRTLAGAVKGFLRRKNPHNVSKFAAWCRTLGKAKIERLVDDLQGRDCASTESAKHPVACTVHRAKGSQHLDVALSHASFRAMVEQGGEEKRVAYVAASRHTRRLFLYGALETPGGKDAENEHLAEAVEATAAFAALKKRKREEDDEVCFF